MGRRLILDHFLNLANWKFLELDASQIHPLSSSEFILHVMVPEASVLLIMEDDGWTGEQPFRSTDWVAARTEACRIRLSSIKFGQGRYREDAEEYRKIIAEVEEMREDLKSTIERIRSEGS